MRICWAQYALWAVIAVFGVLALLSGCGAKGDLFLPPEPQAVEQAAEQASGTEVQDGAVPSAEDPAGDSESTGPTEPQAPPTQDQ